MSKASKAGSSRKGRKAARRQQPPTLKRWPLWAGLVMAAIGGALALYATNTTFMIAKEGLMESSACSINAWINCDAAHGSSYAMLFGIPVAWWGFLFYAWSVLALGLSLTTNDKNTAAAATATVWVLSLGAVLFSLYKAVNLVSLGVLCLVCVGMYAVNIGLAVVVPLAFGMSPLQPVTFLSDYAKEALGKPSGLTFSPNIKTYGIMLLAVFGLGLVGVKNYMSTNIPEAEINVDRLVEAHFRQTPQPIEVPASAVAWGNPEAAITIVEFGDFQCPSCQRAAMHLRPAIYEFRDEVRLYYLHLPLDTSINDNLSRQIHANAGLAARATVCAAEQGDFWGYHDDLFKNQVSIGINLITRLAEDRGWDLQAFTACMDHPDTIARVKSDIEQAHIAQVSSTPTIIISGRKVSAANWDNAELIRAILREELRRAG